MNKMTGSILILIIFLLVSSCAGRQFTEKEQEFKNSAEPIKEEEIISGRSEAYYHFAASRMKTFEREMSGAIAELQKAIESDPDSAYLKYNLALLYLASEENDKAVEQLEKAIETDPQYVPPYKVLGKMYATSNEPEQREKSEEILKKTVDLDPDDYESNLLLGVYYIDSNNFEEAKKYLKRSIEIKPSDIKSYFYLGEVLREQGKLREAEEIYSEILEIDPDNYSTLLTLAVIYENLGEPDKAESYYNQLMRSYSENPLVYEEYGSFLYRNKRIGDAVIQFENAEVMDNTDPDIKLKLGILYAENGRFEDALDKFNYVLKQDPGNDTATYYRGVALARTGNPAEATGVFRSIPPESDYFDNAVIQLALIHDDKGELVKAIELLEKEYAKYPDSAGITNYLGQLYRKGNEYERAVSLYRDYLEKHPDNEQIIYSLAVIYYHSGREDLSISTMKSLLRVNPDHADALNFIGYTYAEKGVNLDEAEQMIRKALELSPDSGYIVDSLGWVYFQRGQYDKAIELISKASGMSPEDPAIKEHLGDAYMKKNENVKALRNYRKALELLADQDMSLKENVELKMRLEEKIGEVYKMI